MVKLKYLGGGGGAGGGHLYAKVKKCRHGGTIIPRGDIHSYRHQCQGGTIVLRNECPGGQFFQGEIHASVLELVLLRHSGMYQ